MSNLASTSTTTNSIYDAIVQSNKFLTQKKEKSTLRKKLLAKSLSLKSSRQIREYLESKYEKKQRLKLKAARRKHRHQRKKATANESTLPSLNALVKNKNKTATSGSGGGGYDEEAQLFDEINSKELNKEESDIPKNDYNQHFVDSGQRPQNFIRDPGLSDRFEEYPKLRELIRLKDELIERTNLPPYPVYYKCDLINSPPAPPLKLSEHLGGCEFDVVLIEPPLREYQRTNGVHFNRYFSWDDIKALDIESVASQRSFVFLWCGAGEGLDKGRECLKKWGFRRCEDICWIKTNKKAPMHNRNVESGAIFQRVKEHCLMGIRGTVRRSTDNDYIHTNVDIDLIITEEPEYGQPDKPKEIFHIIEHFCLGRRRLYLFGRDSTVRPGWLTVGPDLSGSNFDKVKYKQLFESEPNAHLCGTSERIEMLRPKTPPHKVAKQQAPAFQFPTADPIMMLESAIGGGGGPSSAIPPPQPPFLAQPATFMPMMATPPQPSNQSQQQTFSDFNSANNSSTQTTTSASSTTTN